MNLNYFTFFWVSFCFCLPLNNFKPLHLLQDKTFNKQTMRQYPLYSNTIHKIL